MNQLHLNSHLWLKHFFVNFTISKYNKTTCNDPTINITGCGAYCYGYEASLVATLAPAWCVPGPITWKWSYSGGDVTEQTTDAHHSSTLTIKKVTKNIDDIFVIAIDADGVEHRATGCDVIVYDCAPLTSTKTPTATSTPTISSTETTTATYTSTPSGTFSKTSSATPTPTSTCCARCCTRPRPNTMPAKTSAMTHTCANISATGKASRPPTAACRSMAASGWQRIFRSKSCGVMPDRSSSPKARKRFSRWPWPAMCCANMAGKIWKRHIHLSFGRAGQRKISIVLHTWSLNQIGGEV